MYCRLINVINTPKLKLNKTIKNTILVISVSFVSSKSLPVLYQRFYCYSISSYTDCYATFLSLCSLLNTLFEYVKWCEEDLSLTFVLGFSLVLVLVFVFFPHLLLPFTIAKYSVSVVDLLCYAGCEGWCILKICCH